MKSCSARPGPGKSTVTYVDDNLRAQEHLCKAGIERLRLAILGPDVRIQEEVKWNAPSFRLNDHLATVRLHPVPVFQLILHHGSKTQMPPKIFRLETDDELVRWAEPVRCVSSFASEEDSLAKHDAVMRIVKCQVDQV